MIYVKYSNRLGNNLFQWSFGRVLSKLSGAPMSAAPLPLFPKACSEDCLKPSENIIFRMPIRCYFANIEEWVEKAKFGDVLVRGYPHNTAFFEPHRSWLCSEMVPKFGDYAKSGSNDIVLHVRLGDYFYAKNTKFIYPTEVFTRLLSSLAYDRCLIVTDSPESKFIDSLVKDFRGVVVAKDRDHDYRTLYHANRLIMSPSTFSWWSAWTSNAKEIYQPYEMGFWKKSRSFALDLVGQHIRRFDAEGNIL